MVSAVGEAAISGVSLVDMINKRHFVTCLSALATGGAVITSQFLGVGGGRRRLGRAQGELVFLSAVFGLGIMGCLFWVLARRLLRLFFGAIAADVMQAGLTYFRITALSFPSWRCTTRERPFSAVRETARSPCRPVW